VLLNVANTRSLADGLRGLELEGLSLPRLERAIKRSQGYLLSQQKPEGYWIGELMVDCTLVADVIAFHHWDGSVDEKWQRKAVNHIFSLQLPTGGWSIYPGGPAEVNATVKAYLALKLAGVPNDRSAHVARAPNGPEPGRRSALEHLFQAVSRLARPFPWAYVPTIPCEVILIGKWFYVNFNEMSSWSRSMLVPLSIINHFKPTRPLPGHLGRTLSPRFSRARPDAAARPAVFHLAQFFHLAGFGA
jgi:squalene-hopene/tetraprenyl-beta-curcumene cyclase